MSKSQNDDQKLLTVTMDRELYNAFKKTTKSQDRTMSVVVRDFARKYVQKNGQGDLFK